jgi:hypothetical protein
MPPLILKRASTSRSSGQWRDDDYDVLENGVVVARICREEAAPPDRPWMWASGHNGDIKRASYGYEQEGAMAAAFAKWSSIRSVRTVACPWLTNSIIISVQKPRANTIVSMQLSATGRQRCLLFTHRLCPL